MTICHFADVMPDGRVRACLPGRIEYDGSLYTPETQGRAVMLDQAIVWKGPSVTSVLHYSDEAGLQWVESATLVEAQALAWADVKKARDAAESADFAFDGVLYQPDVSKITGAVLAALLPRAEGEPFTINWTVSNNSVVTLDAAQVMGLGLTLTARVNAIHQRGRALRNLIDNAETPEEAFGYTWGTNDE